MGLARARVDAHFLGRMATALTPFQLAGTQGWYFLSTGVWPLVHMRSFEAVTGPKVDKWLVKTVGVLVSVIGCALLLSWKEKKVSTPIRSIAILSAAGLAGIDIVYAARRRIRPIYLADAVAELGLVWAWLRGSTR